VRLDSRRARSVSEHRLYSPLTTAHGIVLPRLDAPCTCMVSPDILTSIHAHGEHLRGRACFFVSLEGLAFPGAEESHAPGVASPTPDDRPRRGRKVYNTLHRRTTG